MLRSSIKPVISYNNIKLCTMFLGSSRCLSSETQYDIIVVGGGLVGSTLACTLGKNKHLSGKRILLLEAGKKRDWKTTQEYSNVVSSLNLGTQKLLSEISAWKHIESERIGRVKGMQIWESNSEALINFNSDSLEEEIAYIVENNVTLKGVYKELQDLDNVNIVYEAMITKYSLADGRKNNEVTLSDGSTYSSALLLGCDGYQSKVRKNMGIHYLSWNYDRMGVVATLEFEEECDNTIAWQRFLPHGPIALLPLNNKLSSLVWSTTPRHAKDLLSLTEDEFVDDLNKSLWGNSKRNFFVEEATRTFDMILKNLRLPSNRDRQLPPKIVKCHEKSRAAFPYGFGHATNYVMEGVALVGDAAHRVHPLAGQGVNLGFGDVACLNKVLGEAAYSGSDLGNIVYLKKYETERQRHNVPTMLAIEGLNKLYGTDFPPAVLLRSIGLQAVNALNPLKALIQNHAAS